jgi:hypothetical protein
VGPVRLQHGELSEHGLSRRIAKQTEPAGCCATRPADRGEAEGSVLHSSAATPSVSASRSSANGSPSAGTAVAPEVVVACCCCCCSCDRLRDEDVARGSSRVRAARGQGGPVKVRPVLTRTTPRGPPPALRPRSIGSREGVRARAGATARGRPHLAQLRPSPGTLRELERPPAAAVGPAPSCRSPRRWVTVDQKGGGASGSSCQFPSVDGSPSVDEEPGSRAIVSSCASAPRAGSCGNNKSKVRRNRKVQRAAAGSETTNRRNR